MQKIMGNLDRVATYVNWPAGTSVSCLSLANSGFMYTGVSDQVICPLCGLVMKEWEQRNVSPLNEHRLRSPNCPFFSQSSVSLGASQLSGGFTRPSLSTDPRRDASSTEQSASNIADMYHSALERAMRHGVIDSNVRATGNTATSRDPETVGIDRANPDYVLLKHESVRLSTFDDWPASHVVQPSALASAGLYYIGRADRTCCAFCRGVLHSWQPLDDPTAEHRRHFPDCPFVRLQQDVGNVPLQRDASLDRELAALRVSDVSQPTASDSRRITAASVEYPAANNRPELPSQGFAAVRNGEHQTSAGHSAELQTQDATTTNTLDEEEQMLMDENRRLHEAKTCKVCMDSEVNTVFLPCGHLVSCDQCAPKLRDCPICRTYIRGTVKTFLI